MKATLVRRLLPGLVLSALLSTGVGIPPAQATGEVAVDVVSSSADGVARVRQEERSVVPGEGTGPQVEVDLDGARQRLHGVGAALTESSAYLLAQLPAAGRRALLQELFDPERGGLSVVRIVIGASDFVLETHSLADSPTPDPDLSTFTIERDRRWVIPVLHEIRSINPEIEILASPWSAPGWMKNTGSYILGLLLPEYEATYADYLVRFLEAYREEGIDVDWLTVQNEPSAIFLDTPSMVMPSEQQARLIGDHLGPALIEAGLRTRVLAWDHNWCDARPTASPPGSCVGTEPTPFPLEVLEATGGAHPLAGTGFHCYGGDQVAANELVHAARPDLQIWQTECSGGAWQADPFADLARLLITDRNHWSNATILWNLALDLDNGPTTGCATCRGVVTVDPATRTWAPELERDLLSTMAWFGGKDSGVLQTTASGSVLASGVCGVDRRPAAIMWNPNGPTTATVHFGALALPIDLAARSLTAVRAPVGVGCELGEWPELPEPRVSIPQVVPGFLDVVEGDEGLVSARVSVQLSTEATEQIDVPWEVIDVAGGSVGGISFAEVDADVAAASGVARFDRGQRETFIELSVMGDRLDEADELAVIRFEIPSNARPGGFYGLGVVRILDDDPPPEIRLGPAVASEGGHRNRIQIPVTLSAPSGRETVISWRTFDGTARGSGDYVAVDTVTVVPAGATRATLEVQLVDDERREFPEWFGVRASVGEEATLLAPSALALVIDDDWAIRPSP